MLGIGFAIINKIKLLPSMRGDSVQECSLLMG